MSLNARSVGAIAGMLLWAGLLPAAVGLTPRQEKAEFFRLIDFDNASLLNHNPDLQTVRSQLATAATQGDSAALATYASAITNLWNATPANNYSCGRSRVQAGSTAFATNFFSWIDLDHPGLEQTKAYVQTKNYTAALAAWRDYTVTKFRQLDFPQLYQQSYKTHPRQQNISQLLLGEMSYADYTNSSLGVNFYEIYGMSGAPGTIGPIAWTNQPPTADTSEDTVYSYANMACLTPLVCRYWGGRMVGFRTELTLSCIGTLVTATCVNPHGLSNGEQVYVSGATPAAYNGFFNVTVLNATQVTYTALSAPGSSPAGGTSRQLTRPREIAALQKWFEVLSNFSTRQKNMVSALQFVEIPTNRAIYRTLYERCDWSVLAGTALAQAGRVQDLLSGTAILCKLLPEVTPVQRNWATAIQDPVTTPLAPGSMELIPPESLARLALSLMADSTEALMLRYVPVGSVPNQRLSGLQSLYLTAAYLEEFKAAPELLRQADAALADFATGNFYPDGAMLERSPNYNAGTAEAMRFLAGLAVTNATPGVALFPGRLAAYDRVTAFMQTPVTGVPRMSSYGGPNPPDLWNGGSVLTSWRNSFLAGVAGITEPTAAGVYAGMLDSTNPAPPVTSAAFPYAGYYTQRNGWGNRAHSLYFANTAHGRGHFQYDHNAIQVTAFGRRMLSTGGPAPYGPTFLDPSQADDLEGFGQYLGSSFQVSTVNVDGRSQNEGGVINLTATTNTIPGAWFTSAAFDYVDGTYSDGYGGTAVYNPFTNATTTVDTVTHKRSVIFLRNPGVWIVTDRMTATDAATHDYRQIWKFPGYSDSLKCYGFDTNQVIAHNGLRRIYTTDADGPNIHLYHLGPAAVTYRNYAGSRNPYLGWFSIGIGGLRLATRDIHAQWQGAGNQLLVTVIAPSDTGRASPVTAIRTNASTATSINIEFDLDNGHTVKLVQGLQPQTLAVGNRSLTAATIVNDVAPDGEQQGLALGATGFANANFSFTADAASCFPVSNITTPVAFQWANAGGWLVPAPSAGGYTWWGSVSSLWTNAGNWAGNAAPGNSSSVYFETIPGGSTTPTITALRQVGAINISGETSYTFTQNGVPFWINLAAPITSTSAADQTFDGALSVTATNATLLNQGKGLIAIVGGILKYSGSELCFDGGGNFVVTSIRKRNGSDTANLVKNGAGEMLISGYYPIFSTNGASPSGFTGTTTINGGAIRVSSGDARSLGHALANTPGWLTLNGGALHVSTADLNLGVNSTEGIRLGAGGGTFNVDEGLTLTGGGAGGVNAISGSGNLTKTGAGTLTLAGPHTYTGATTVEGGTLIVDGSALGSSYHVGLFKTNVALAGNGGVASQSSTYSSAVASRAIDGNTNSAWAGGSVAHTGDGAAQWWQVDWPATCDVSVINLYTRTDCCAVRQSNIRVSLFDGATEVFSRFYPGTMAAVTSVTLPAGAQGDRVRLQIVGNDGVVGGDTDRNDEDTGFMGWAEVEVFGSAVAGSATLLVNGSLANTAVTVAPDGKLGGIGTIDGSVTVNGTLSPGHAAGTLTISNDLVLAASATLALELGTNSDRIAVAGSLTLDGTLNLADAGGFGTGTYTLITYAGALTNNGLVVGSVPSPAFAGTLDTSTPGRVNLIVSLTPLGGWLAENFGSLTNSAAAPGADADGDGLNNEEEYLSGTQPTNRASVLQSVSVARDSNGFYVVTWDSVGGKSYRVQYSNGDAGGGYAGVFVDIPLDLTDTNVPGVFGVMQFTDDFVLSGTPLSNRYYRVRTE